MFDIGMMELLIIGIVALIVVGPKDLPGMFRTIGRFVGKARAMAREFQRAMEAAADESGVKDMAREFRDAASGKDFGADALRDIAKGPKHWVKEAAKRSVVAGAGDGATGVAADGRTSGGAAPSSEADPASAPVADGGPGAAPEVREAAVRPEEGGIRPEKP